MSGSFLSRLHDGVSKEELDGLFLGVLKEESEEELLIASTDMTDSEIESLQKSI